MSHSTTFRSIRVGLALIAAVGLQTAGRMEAVQIPLDAVVLFGAAHPQPDPPAHHVLLPEEVTILKGGTVTFQVNGGGHGIAIYPVSNQTTRDDILADLCPSGLGAPVCAGATAHAPFFITDGKGDLIVDTGAFLPAARAAFDYAPGRLLAAIGGSAVFLNGSTEVTVPPATVPAPGVRLVQTFPKTGRYLVICMNRFHLINDYMFGFVNVVGSDEQ